jgi:uncharacterized protein
MSRALSLAAQKGDLEKVRAALDDGADIEFRSKQTGRTPLIEATIEEHIDVARLLVDRGASLTAQDTAVGLTPLAWAAEHANEELVELFLAAGAEANAASKEYHLTTLMIACGKGSVPIVKRLLAAGADVNAATVDGRRPLGFARTRKHGDVAKVIEKAGGTDVSPLPRPPRIPWPPGKECDYSKPESVLKSFMVAMNRVEKQQKRRGFDATLAAMQVILATHVTAGKKRSTVSSPPEYDIEQEGLIDAKVGPKRAELITRDAKDENEFRYVALKKKDRWLLDTKQRRTVGAKWLKWWL